MPAVKKKVTTKKKAVAKRSAPQLPKHSATVAPKAKKQTVKKLPATQQAKPKARVKDGPRMLKNPKYSSFRLRKRIKDVQPPPPKVRELLKQTWRVIKERPKLFIGIAAVHLFLTLALVRGFTSQVDIAGTRDILSSLYGGATGKAITTISLFGQLVSTSNSANASASASAYQPIVTIVVALAAIWAARQQGTKTPIRVRDAFYRGMYPVIPFVIVLFVVGLQFIPATVGGWLYSTVVAGGIAVSALEKFMWTILVVLFLILSLYLVTASVFALFIVTLPDMTPRRALKSARRLVLHRRWTIASRIVAMMIGLLIALSVVLLPVLLLLPAIAEVVFVLLSAFGIVIPVVYMYNLYYGLLSE